MATKKGKCLGRCGTSRGHTTKLKQSILLDIYGLNIELIRNLWFENFFHRMEIIKDGIEQNRNGALDGYTCPG
jgi:hypothetical protein